MKCNTTFTFASTNVAMFTLTILVSLASIALTFGTTLKRYA